MRLRRIILLLLWLVACALCQAQVVTTIDRTHDPVPEEVVPHNTNNDNQPHQTTQPAKSDKTKTQPKQTEKVYSLSVSTSSLSFSAAGGTQTITVSSSQPWHIDVGTYSWGHLTKNGSQLTVKIDPNNNTSSRTDYFTIKSGDKTQRINISQSGRATTYTSNSSTIRPTNSSRYYYDTGSVVQFGIEVTDFAWNIFSTGNGNVIHYDVGLSVKFGHHRSPVQFELGIKPGILWDMEDYDDDDEYGTVKFRMPIYARLKINLCNVGDNGKLYISGMAYYNAIRDKRYENRFSAGGGAGFAWRH